VRPSRSNRRVWLLRDFAPSRSYTERRSRVMSTTKELGSAWRQCTTYRTPICLRTAHWCSRIRRFVCNLRVVSLFRDVCHCETQGKRALRDEARWRSLFFWHNRPTWSRFQYLWIPRDLWVPSSLYNNKKMWFFGGKGEKKITCKSRIQKDLGTSLTIKNV